MHPSKPLGNSSFAPLFLRIPLGLYFALAGYSKLQNIEQFVVEVQGFSFLPKTVATLYATVLPFVEIAVGGMLIIGLWTTAAALLASLMLASFIYALGLKTSKLGPFNKDIILLGVSLALLYTGGGNMSMDKAKEPQAG